MSTYSDLRQETFKGIDTLASAFELLTRDWKLSAEFIGDVLTPLQGSNWRGDAAERAAATITRTRNELDAAFEEAGAIGKALRDAHTELAAARADLDAALKRAADHSLTVDADGVNISWPAPTSDADKHDPTYATTYKALAQSVGQDIGKAVARAKAATTGRAFDAQDAPLPQHTPEMAKVMHDVVDRLGSGDGPKLLRKGADFADLAPSLGHLTAAYMGDVQVALNPEDGALTTYGAPAKLNQGNVEKLLGALGRNPDAFGAIAQAQQAYTTARIQDVMLHRDVYGPEFDLAVTNAAHSGGEVAGYLTAGRTAGLVDEMKGQAKAYNDSIGQNAMWGKAIWAATGGRVAGDLPVVGKGLSLPVNYFIDQVASSYYIDPNTADPATRADDEGFNAAAASAKKTVEQAAQGTGLNQERIQALATGAAKGVLAGGTYAAGRFGRAVNG
ncbi:hypothetical protein [Kitasatospora sp. NPDC094011]|uniref:hypothetical protein n=1 Tax=Kitasatospora sp. NPDC094011 TaxID=3364090 RepID=UPI0037FAA890